MNLGLNMDQWLKTGTIKNNKRTLESDELVSTSQVTSKTQVQNTENAPSSVLQIAKKRKYCDEYMKYGFSYTGGEDSPKPKCVVCGEVLSNGSMKHLQTKHANYKNKEFFFKRLAAQNMKMSVLTSYILPANKDNENATEASYRISYRIATCGKNGVCLEKNMCKK